ncbi:MAG: hypothetical protein ACR9NN_21050 [Nostochopsis sp.]
MARLAPKVLNLNESDRSELQQLINRHNTAQQMVLRAKNNSPSVRGKKSWRNRSNIRYQSGYGSVMEKPMVGNQWTRIIDNSKITRYGAYWSTSKI